MNTIKTWVERLPDGVRFCPSTTEMIPAMREEIAELRAALAASGGNAAPGLTDEQIDEICNVQEAKYGQLCDTEDMRMFARAIEAASAPNAALVAALEKMVSAFEGRSPSGYDEYLDEADVIAARAALSAAGQEVGK